MPSPKILVIGIGNPLRGDDGVGQGVIKALRADVQSSFVKYRDVFQLLPEHAADLAEISHVIFVDACVEGRPGTVTRHKFQSVLEAPTRAIGHHLSPDWLLWACQSWYGRSPEAVLYTVSGCDFDHQESLSPPVISAVPVATHLIKQELQSLLSQQSQYTGLNVHRDA